MLIRNGYVSNSSSSSFVVYGFEVDSFKKAKELVFSGKEVYCVEQGGGWSGDCGDFVFKLTNERCELLSKHHRFMKEWISRINIICVEFIAVGGDADTDKTIDVPDLKDGMFFEFDRDDNSAWTDAIDDEHFQRWIQ